MEGLTMALLQVPFDPKAFAPRPLSDMGQAALDYAARCWPVFPVDPNSKKPIGRLAPHGFKDATTDRAQIEAWWRQRPDAMIGVPTGKATGVFVLDVDVDPEKSVNG